MSARLVPRFIGTPAEFGKPSSSSGGAANANDHVGANPDLCRATRSLRRRLLLGRPWRLKPWRCQPLAHVRAGLGLARFAEQGFALSSGGKLPGLLSQTGRSGAGRYPNPDPVRIRTAGLSDFDINKNAARLNVARAAAFQPRRGGCKTPVMMSVHNLCQGFMSRCGTPQRGSGHRLQRPRSSDYQNIRMKGRCGPGVQRWFGRSASSPPIWWSRPRLDGEPRAGPPSRDNARNVP
ncbi:hypothetical protein M2171_003989 [Bradyrhizobium japonicum USDA 38]|nr:hypothetical protein [Bradyrhizobium japonicum USDA 38]MCS3947371.1 hypothetical protein [Bradyrhizobium japonicum]MCW2219799.1 hypothetical protein [Bradyrhizobium japonicum]MCW2344413.1 hypothetical protein [Bradyrhizobium japonicum]